MARIAAPVYDAPRRHVQLHELCSTGGEKKDERGRGRKREDRVERCESLRGTVVLQKKKLWTPILPSKFMVLVSVLFPFLIPPTLTAGVVSFMHARGLARRTRDTRSQVTEIVEWR